VSEPLARAGSATIISQGGGPGSGTGTAKLSEDVVQVLSQLNPIMQQLAGVNLSSFLQDISKLPAAVADNLSSAGRGAEGAAKGPAKAGPPAE